MSQIPEIWLPKVRMKRIICHWTAGSYQPSDNDLDHYHILIDGKGKVHRGHHSIKQNHHKAHGGYAAHTYGLNTDSIGVAVCCMGGAQGKHDLGRYPLKKVQWETLARVVAELCLAYDLEPTERQVLQHGDVHRVFGIDQWGKWDINYLPWSPRTLHDDVGHQFRDLVKSYLHGAEHSRDGVVIKVNGKPIQTGVIIDGVAMVPTRAIAEALGAKVTWEAESKSIHITSENNES